MSTQKLFFAGSGGQGILLMGQIDWYNLTMSQKSEKRRSGMMQKNSA